MPADISPLDGLLLRWRDLPPGDRRAIVRLLPPDRQADFARAFQRAQAEGRPPRGRYSGHSRWLADLLAACASDAPPGPSSSIRPKVREALVQGHAQAEELRGAAKPSSLLDLIRGALSERGFLP